MQRVVLDAVERAGRRPGLLVVGITDGSETAVASTGPVPDPADVPERVVFEIGSVTKVFTSLLLAIAVERGEVRLDDPLAVHLPPGTRVSRRADRQITLVHLATHTSGAATASSSLPLGGGPSPRGPVCRSHDRAGARRTCRDATAATHEERARGGRLAPALRMGLGWFLLPIGRQKVATVWHNGGTGGYRSYVGWAPAIHAGIVVLSSNARSVDRVGTLGLLDLASDENTGAG